MQFTLVLGNSRLKSNLRRGHTAKCGTYLANFQEKRVTKKTLKLVCNSNWVFSCNVRYFDTNRDTKLEYVEFKELVAAARAARQLPVDALSVARDADSCLRYTHTRGLRQFEQSE